MGKPSNPSADIAELAKDIVRTSAELVREQVELFRAEVRDELRQAAGGASAVAAGGGLVAVSGLLGMFSAVHLLEKMTGLPRWACYGAVGGACAVAGGALIKQGTRQLGDVQLLPPPQTAKALEENLTWLKEELSPAGR